VNAEASLALGSRRAFLLAGIEEKMWMQARSVKVAKMETIADIETLRKFTESKVFSC
jgi:hypothetical protein